MVRLNHIVRYDLLIRHILGEIIECEGGHINTFNTKKKSASIQIVPDIPPEFWCDRCKKRAIRYSKLVARWEKPTKR